MKLLIRRRTRSKHRHRIWFIREDFDRARLLYRVELRFDGHGCDRWVEAEFGKYADRTQTDQLRTTDEPER